MFDTKFYVFTLRRHVVSKQVYKFWCCKNFKNITNISSAKRWFEFWRALITSFFYIIFLYGEQMTKTEERHYWLVCIIYYVLSKFWSCKESFQKILLNRVSRSGKMFFTSSNCFNQGSICEQWVQVQNSYN